MKVKVAEPQHKSPLFEGDIVRHVTTRRLFIVCSHLTNHLETVLVCLESGKSQLLYNREVFELLDVNTITLSKEEK